MMLTGLDKDSGVISHQGKDKIIFVQKRGGLVIQKSEIVMD